MNYEVEHKQTQFGPKVHQPSSGKTLWIASADISSLEGKSDDADAIIANCTTSIPFKIAK
jgi:hypothetical protein